MSQGIGASVQNEEFVNSWERNQKIVIHDKWMFLYGTNPGNTVDATTDFVKDLTNCMTSKFDTKQDYSIRFP